MNKQVKAVLKNLQERLETLEAQREAFLADRVRKPEKTNYDAAIESIKSQIEKLRKKYE